MLEHCRGPDVVQVSEGDASANLLLHLLVAGLGGGDGFLYPVKLARRLHTARPRQEHVGRHKLHRRQERLELCQVADRGVVHVETDPALPKFARLYLFGHDLEPRVPRLVRPESVERHVEVRHDAAADCKRLVRRRDARHPSAQALGFVEPRLFRDFSRQVGAVAHAQREQRVQALLLHESCDQRKVSHKSPLHSLYSNELTLNARTPSTERVRIRHPAAPIE